MNKEYVLGFVFDTVGKNVLLIQKKKPGWQRDRLNGIGGKIDEGETPAAAMEREACEETCLFTRGEDEVRRSLTWNCFGRLSGNGFCVYLFSIFIENIQSHRDILGLSATDEPTFIFPVNALPESVIPNLRWMIPMALSMTRGEPCRHFHIKEIDSSSFAYGRVCGQSS